MCVLSFLCFVNCHVFRLELLSFFETRVCDCAFFLFRFDVVVVVPSVSLRLRWLFGLKRALRVFFQPSMHRRVVQQPLRHV